MLFFYSIFVGGFSFDRKNIQAAGYVGEAAPPTFEGTSAFLRSAVSPQRNPVRLAFGLSCPAGMSRSTATKQILTPTAKEASSF